METVVSGIRSTGKLHLGNYYGAVQNFVRMQHDYNCFFFIADYHSLTTHPTPDDLHGNVKQVLLEYLAAGLDPEKATLYVQSDVPEIAELYLYLNMNAYLGELERSTSFKDKVRAQPDNVNAGLLTYPVLMAADILIHKATKVPVGKDQEQHLEMARNMANRFNNRYGELFPEPYPFNFGSELIKVPSLDGNGKMSKSENVNATIYLADDDDTIRKKTMKAKSGLSPEQANSPMTEDIQNLFSLMRLMTDANIVAQYEAAYADCSIRFGDMKKQLAEDMIRFVAPIRERAADLQKDEARLQRILKEGAEKARVSAQATLQEARKLIGINYY